MAIDTTIFTNDMRKILSDIPQTITLASGVVVSACVTTGDETDLLEESGVTDVRKLTAVVMIADCAVLPKANDVISYGGNDYRVSSFAAHDDNIAATIQAVGEWE